MGGIIVTNLYTIYYMNAARLLSEETRKRIKDTRGRY